MKKTIALFIILSNILLFNVNAERKKLDKPIYDIKDKIKNSYIQNPSIPDQKIPKIQIEYNANDGKYYFSWIESTDRKKYRGWFEPAYLLDVTVVCFIKEIENTGELLFEYSLYNDIKSKQRIKCFNLEYQADIYNVVFPDKWVSTYARRVKETLQQNKKIWMWFCNKELAIKQGNSLNNIAFHSKGLPGIVLCYVQGDTKRTGGLDAKFMGEVIPEIEVALPRFYDDWLRGQTVGAVEWFNSIPEGLSRIEQYITDSYDLGWIESVDEKNKLAATTAELKAILNSNQSVSVKNKKICDYIDLVNKSYTNRKILSEAHVLLYYNSRALLKFIK